MLHPEKLDIHYKLLFESCRRKYFPTNYSDIMWDWSSLFYTTVYTWAEHFPAHYEQQLKSDQFIILFSLEEKGK